MDLATSQKVVRIFGIIDIVVGVLVLVGGVGMFGLGGAGAAVGDLNDKNVVLGAGILMLLGIIMLVSGIASILEGVFSLRAAKDASKVKPLWVLSIINIVLSVINLIGSFSNDGTSIFSGIISLAINAVIFYLANNIKNYAR